MFLPATATAWKPGRRRVELFEHEQARQLLRRPGPEPRSRPIDRCNIRTWADIEDRRAAQRNEGQTPLCRDGRRCQCFRNRDTEAVRLLVLRTAADNADIPKFRRCLA